MYVNDAFLAYYNKPARARLRGLVENPAISGALLRRLVDEHRAEVRFCLGGRRQWSDEQFDALADHPDPDVQVHLAKALHVRPEQRARLVGDASFKVLLALASGPTPFDLPITTREPMLPLWAYDRLIDKASITLGGPAMSAITDLRRIIYGLRLPALDELSLPGSLREQIGRSRCQAPALAMGLDAPSTGPADLPVAVQVAFVLYVGGPASTLVRG